MEILYQDGTRGLVSYAALRDVELALRDERVAEIRLIKQRAIAAASVPATPRVSVPRAQRRIKNAKQRKRARRAS